MTKTTDSCETSQSKRRWRIFLTVELVVLLLMPLGIWAASASGVGKNFLVVLSIFFSIVALWLVITLPICICYLLGHPIVLSLSPLVPSAESRAFWKDLESRFAMTDEEFFCHFYRDSEIPKFVIVGVRKSLTKFHTITDRLVPTDNLRLLDDELDLADLLRWIGKEFHVEFTRKDYPCVDGTLNNLIHNTHNKVLEKSALKQMPNQ